MRPKKKGVFCSIILQFLRQACYPSCYLHMYLFDCDFSKCCIDCFRLKEIFWWAVILINLSLHMEILFWLFVTLHTLSFYLFFLIVAFNLQSASWHLTILDFSSVVVSLDLAFRKKCHHTWAGMSSRDVVISWGPTCQ